MIKANSVQRHVRQVVRWYMTPAGIFSAVAIAAAVVVAIFVDASGGTFILAAWVGLVLPYKLMRERRDWSAAVENIQQAHRKLPIKQMRSQIGELQTGLTATPTIDEIQNWQAGQETKSNDLQGQIRGLDRLISDRANEADADLQQLVARLEDHAIQLERLETQSPAMDMVTQLSTELDHHRDRLAELVRQVDQLGTALDRQVKEMDEQAKVIDEHTTEIATTPSLDQIKDQFEKLGSGNADRLANQVYRQLEGLIGVYSALQPTMPLPQLDGWALSPQAIAFMTSTIGRDRPELVVEAGSGASTVAAALALAKNGHGKVIALEHDQTYARRTRRALQDQGVEKYAEVHVCSLIDVTIDSESYRWYDIAGVDLNGPIGLLVIDGPPGTTGHHARYPAIPMLLEHLSPETVVLVDDTEREQERETMERWRTDYGLQYDERDLPTGFARARVLREHRDL
jgi:predicted O-methyltransferase YrrM